MKNYVFFDVETTGLDYTADQVIEIAAVKADENLRVLSAYNDVVRLEDGRKLDPFIAELTRLSEKILASGIPERAALEQFVEFVGDDSVIVAHNAPFDISFTYGRLNKPNPPFICTRAMSFLANPRESASLAKVCKRHGIETLGHHRAMVDAELCLDIFGKLREELDARKIDYKDVIIDFVDRPIVYVPDCARIVYPGDYRKFYREQFEREDE
jgi:DNA polymerase III alpha subunit (gram-positive type)